jgi:hypothetical protein
VRRFDFGVSGDGGVELFINSVRPHERSVAAKYVAFADADVERDRKLAVFDEALSTPDAALLQQVVDAAPISALNVTAQRMLASLQRRRA